jgi:hypothetical protein
MKGFQIATTIRVTLIRCHILNESIAYPGVGEKKKQMMESAQLIRTVLLQIL